MALLAITGAASVLRQARGELRTERERVAAGTR
jgi:hypothetical protein